MTNWLMSPINILDFSNLRTHIFHISHYHEIPSVIKTFTFIKAFTKQKQNIFETGLPWYKVVFGDSLFPY